MFTGRHSGDLLSFSTAGMSANGCNSLMLQESNQDEEFTFGDSKFLAVTLLNYATPHSKSRAPAGALGGAVIAVESHAYAGKCENRTG